MEKGREIEPGAFSLGATGQARPMEELGSCSDLIGAGIRMQTMTRPEHDPRAVLDIF